MIDSGESDSIPPHEQDVTKGQSFMRGLTGLNS